MDNATTAHGMIVSNPNRDPPILRLHRDLLWYIFKTNANMFSHRGALQTTRFTSQVCWAWRNLLLDAHSLWARLIDIDNLELVAEDWRNELLRRSGKSPIWVMYTNLKSDSQIGPLARFFFFILDTHWERIERLVVEIYNFFGPLDPNFLRPLYRPAPLLQVFDLYTINQMNIGSILPLFSKDAPNLRQFRAKHVKFDLLGTPWLSGLSSIHFGPPFTSEEILCALALTPLLEYLGIDDLRQPYQRLIHRPVASLPNLSELRLYDNLKTCVDILECIVVPEKCLLFLSASTIPANDVHEDGFRSSLEPLSQFTRRYFNYCAPEKLYLKTSQSTFKFKEFRKYHHGGDSIFQISLGTSFPTLSITALLDAFAFPELSKVVELHLVMRYSPPRASFTPFATYLSSLKVIQTESQVISYLSEVQDNTSTLLFPSLEVIKLNTLNIIDDNGMFVPDDETFTEVHPFLLSRSKAGCPISILDLTKCDLGLAPPLECLDELLGMKIRWARPGYNSEDNSEDILEYNCGAGIRITL